MNVVEGIRKMIRAYEQETGHKPEKLHLPWQDYHALKREIVETTAHCGPEHYPLMLETIRVDGVEIENGEAE